MKIDAVGADQIEANETSQTMSMSGALVGLLGVKSDTAADGDSVVTFTMRPSTLANVMGVCSFVLLSNVALCCWCQYRTVKAQKEKEYSDDSDADDGTVDEEAAYQLNA